ncbi:MAG TPA: hypothetical protein VGD12_02215 [Blastococcus sp.]
MRRSLSACRRGLSVAVVAVLLSGCGGAGDDGTPAAESSDATSRFCTEAASIQERVGSTVSDPSRQADLPEVLQASATEIRAVEAPSEIFSDWNALADGAEQLSAVIGSVDPDQPDAFAGIEQQLDEVTSRLSGASTNVSDYLRNECGIDVATTGPASPTS